MTSIIFDINITKLSSSVLNSSELRRKENFIKTDLTFPISNFSVFLLSFPFYTSQSETICAYFILLILFCVSFDSLSQMRLFSTLRKVFHLLMLQIDWRWKWKDNKHFQKYINEVSFTYNLFHFVLLMKKFCWWKSTQNKKQLNKFISLSSEKLDEQLVWWHKISRPFYFISIWEHFNQI